MKKIFLLLFLFGILSSFTNRIKAQKTVYIPTQMRNEGYSETDTSKMWCKKRSIEGQDIVIFWQKGYGANDPNSSEVKSAYRVDTKDMLAKLESFYDLNVNKLKFAGESRETSNLNSYKMVILLYYTTNWMAYGAGFDDLIGGMWVSPATCHPVGQTIAHEIGHSFQYQCYCDLKGYTGFRYAVGQGNTFWEQTAQWQSYNAYPEQSFKTYDFTVYKQNYFRAFTHEWQRYASYFMHWYMADKHGVDIVARIWRENLRDGADVNQKYMAITGINTKELYRQYMDAAMKFVTWDIESLREIGKDFIGAQTYQYIDLSNHKFQVPYSFCPQSTGYNVISLRVPAVGTKVSTIFSALPVGCNLAAGDPGKVRVGDSTYVVTKYNNVTSTLIRGFRHGYVALLKDGTRLYQNNDSVYAVSHTDMIVDDTSSFVIPENTEKLWFVISPAPRTYVAHKWDEDERTDDQWPYQVQFLNTDILGHVDMTGERCDTTIHFNVGFDASSSSYTGVTIPISVDDQGAMMSAFKLNIADIKSAIVGWRSTMNDGNIMFYAEKAMGSIVNAGSTANGYGHWFDATGNVSSYSNGFIYSEFDKDAMIFNVGQFPGKCKNGNTYTIKQGLRYYKNGKYNTVHLVFHVYMGGIPAGVKSVEATSQSKDVYDITGKLVRKAIPLNNIKTLAKGLYIVDGKKYLVE